MGDQHGQKFDAGDELMVASETGVVATLVVDHAGVEIGQPCERNGSALHVLKDRLELVAVARFDDAFDVNPEAGVLPRSHQVGTLLHIRAAA